MSSFFCQTNCCADRIRKVPSPIRFAIPQAAHSRAVRCPLPGKCPPQAGGRLPGVSRKPPCPLTRTPRTMKALRPLRAAHSCDPTCIRNPACRAFTAKKGPPAAKQSCSSPRAVPRFLFPIYIQIALVYSFSQAASSSVRWGAIFSYTSLW